jgi:Fe-Mn family superoxide dismutase
MNGNRSDTPQPLSRRDFLQQTAVASAGIAVLAACGTTGSNGAAETIATGPSDALMAAVALPPLPYAADALAPVISAETMAFHHGKHHAAYANNLAKLLPSQPGLATVGNLEALVRATAGRPEYRAIYNNAAQLWNHTFYFEGFRPGGGAPGPALETLIARDFGDFASLKKRLVETATGQFGSGWGWLVLREGRLEVIATPDADSPLTTEARPLLTLDVWEHAYYIDFRNQRAPHLEAVVDKVIAWDIVTRRLEA